MAKNQFSRNVQQEIVVAYQGGEPTKAIMERYGIPNHPALYKILDDWKIERRNPSNGGGKNKKSVKKATCKCGHINPVGSKYCNQCGASLKTEEELILEGLLNARGKCLRYVNQGIRADVDAQIMAAVELIRKTFNIKE